jgi:hypothetical protein
MQLLNCLLALGGDKGNTVPKYGITAAEAGLLRAIHGDDAVHDVEPLDKRSARTARAEISRLAELYPAKDEDGRTIISTVYSSVANVPELVEDIGLAEEHFKPLARATATTPRDALAPEPAAEAPKRRGRPRKVEAPAPDNDATSVFDDGPGEDVAEPSVLD